MIELTTSGDLRAARRIFFVHFLLFFRFFLLFQIVSFLNFLLFELTMSYAAGSFSVSDSRLAMAAFFGIEMTVKPMILSSIDQDCPRWVLPRHDYQFFNFIFFPRLSFVLVLKTLFGLFWLLLSYSYIFFSVLQIFFFLLASSYALYRIIRAKYS